MEPNGGYSHDAADFGEIDPTSDFYEDDLASKFNVLGMGARSTSSLPTKFKGTRPTDGRSRNVLTGRHLPDPTLPSAAFSMFDDTDELMGNDDVFPSPAKLLAAMDGTKAEESSMFISPAALIASAERGKLSDKGVTEAEAFPRPQQLVAAAVATAGIGRGSPPPELRKRVASIGGGTSSPQDGPIVGARSSSTASTKVEETKDEAASKHAPLSAGTILAAPPAARKLSSPFLAADSAAAVGGGATSLSPPPHPSPSRQPGVGADREAASQLSPARGRPSISGSSAPMGLASSDVNSKVTSPNASSQGIAATTPLGPGSDSPSRRPSQASGKPAPLRFHLPKEFGEFNFNHPGRKLLTMRRFKRLVTWEMGYDILEAVLVLCNDICFLAVPVDGDERNLLLMHRPHARTSLLVNKAPSLYGNSAFMIAFSPTERYLLKATSAQEAIFWGEKLTLYRSARSRDGQPDGEEGSSSVDRALEKP